MGIVHDTASFIAAGKAKFEEQYDYSEAVYVDASTKMRLYCTLHGEPVQVDVSSQVHLYNKGGCKTCKGQGAKARHGKTTEKFIAEAKEVFGDRFGYDKVKYGNAKTEVEIHCNKHNEDFGQIPEVHLRGSSGCKKCKSEAISASNALMYEERRVPFSEFLERAKIHHGEWYSYDESSYIGFSKNTLITCPKHGPFPQRASRHAEGEGCKSCRNEEMRIIRKEWRARIREKFPDIRVRILEAWRGYDTQVKAKCLVHHDRLPWTLTARSLYNGNGCRECERDRKDASAVRRLLQRNPDLPEELRTSTNLSFLRFAARATKKFAGRYHYSERGFLFYSRPCTVVCPQHREFKVFPESHVRGDACPLCDQKEKFIAKSKERFGSQYDYSKVEFTRASMDQTVALSCLHHKTEFQQRAQSHLDGFLKCDTCRAEQTEKAIKERCQARIPRMVKDFKSEAKEVHGDKYDYPHLEIELNGWSANITILCKEHKRKSTPTAAEHLGHYGRKPMGCQSCKGTKARLRLRKSYEEVKRALGLQGFIMLAEEEDYINMRTKVRIRCDNGHENDLVPQKILTGHGCPDCPSRIGEAICRSILEEMFETLFKTRHFKQKDYPDLIAPYHHLEVDGYSPLLAIAFEYQGVYHRLRKVHRNPQDYEKQIERDKATAHVCKTLKIPLIIINEFSYPFHTEDVRNKINDGLARAKIDSKFCLTKPLDLGKHTPMVNKNGIKRMQALAKKQNLVALDKQWFGEWHTYNWQCKECNKPFRSPYAVRNAAKHDCCPSCARGKEEVVAQSKKTRLERFAADYLSNLEKRASNLGLVLLDKEWKGSGKEQVYRFRCRFNKGPVIKRAYNNLQKHEPGCSCGQHQELRRKRLAAASRKT